MLCYSSDSTRLVSPCHASLQRGSGRLGGRAVRRYQVELDLLTFLLRLSSIPFYRIQLQPYVHTRSYCCFLCCNCVNFPRVIFFTHNETPTQCPSPPSTIKADVCDLFSLPPAPHSTLKNAPSLRDPRDRLARAAHEIELAALNSG